MDQRRTFSREFKLAAVNNVVEQGLSYREVARQLNIRDTYLHN
jgi:transposase-like protein